MADLVFATRGQAEMLAHQEAVRKKALETKQEFEEASKATGAWDASMAKLKSSAESALRSVNTEQEKILDKIAKIQEAQEKGLIPPEAAKEAEDAIARLRQQWVDVDEATVKAREEAEKLKAETEAVAREHVRLKSTAESALRSILTEEERIVEQILHIEEAMQKGLVPPDEAEAGLEKLRGKLEEIQNETDEVGAAGGKVSAIFAKAFDPTQVLKWVAGFASVKTIISEVRDEFNDLQTAIDKRIAANLKPKEQGDRLTAAAEAANVALQNAERSHADKIAAFDKAQADEAKARGGTPAEQSRARERVKEASGAMNVSADEAWAARGVAQAAEQERDRFMATPAFKRATALSERRKTLDNLYDDIAAAGDVSAVSTEELKKLADVMREAGQSRLSLRVMDFAAKIDDGVTTIDEVKNQLQIAANEVRGRVDGQIVSAGGAPVRTEGRYRTDNELSLAERKQIELLTRAANAYEEQIRILRMMEENVGSVGTSAL